jgi:hypothetical protein
MFSVLHFVLPYHINKECRKYVIYTETAKTSPMDCGGDDVWGFPLLVIVLFPLQPSGQNSELEAFVAMVTTADVLMNRIGRWLEENMKNYAGRRIVAAQWRCEWCWCMGCVSMF